MDNRKILKVLNDNDFEFLKGQKTENYFQFMSHMEYDIKKEEMEGLRLDATGYCPGLAKKLGEDYLKDYIVITSINQRDDIIVRDDRSYLRPLINYIYTPEKPLFDLIHDITLKEVLIGKMSCYYDRIRRSLFVEVDLETPGQSISRIREIVKEISSLRSDPYRMLSKSRTERLKKLIKEPCDISEKFPTLDIIRIPEGKVLPVRREMFCFRETDKNGDVYYFAGKRNMVIYFSRVKPNVYMGNDVDIFLSGTNTDQVLNVLFRHGYIGFREDLTNNTLEEIARNSIEATVTTSSFYSDIGVDPGATAGQVKARVEEYKNIRNKVTKNENQNNMLFRELDVTTKRDLVEARKNRREIMELLSKLEPENYIKMYMYDPGRFKNQFTEATDDEKQSMLSRVISYTERTQKYNLPLNTWLAEYHFKTCKEAGIRFVV